MIFGHKQMTYMFDIWRLCFSQALCLASAAAKTSSWNGFGCVRICAAIASACARMDYMRGGMARCAVACEVPAGRAISVGFRRNCIQQFSICNLAVSKRLFEDFPVKSNQ